MLSRIYSRKIIRQVANSSTFELFPRIKHLATETSNRIMNTFSNTNFRESMIKYVPGFLQNYYAHVSKFTINSHLYLQKRIQNKIQEISDIVNEDIDNPAKHPLLFFLIDTSDIDIIKKSISNTIQKIKHIDPHTRIGIATTVPFKIKYILWPTSVMEITNNNITDSLNIYNKPNDMAVSRSIFILLSNAVLPKHLGTTIIVITDKSSTSQYYDTNAIINSYATYPLASINIIDCGKAHDKQYVDMCSNYNGEYLKISKSDISKSVNYIFGNKYISSLVSLKEK